jgi:hypothetical protein
VGITLEEIETFLNPFIELFEAGSGEGETSTQSYLVRILSNNLVSPSGMF